MMRYNRMICGMLCFLIVFSCSNIYADSLPDDRFILGPGDVLDISVWKNDELSKLVQVLPDGYIMFPLVGEIKAAGSTVLEFQNALQEKLKQYIPQPSLSVIVKNINVNIYILGKVQHPGMYGLKSKIHVLQALTMAGGLNLFAQGDEIQILRKIGNETKIYKFDYDKVAAGKSLEQDIEIVRGDVIVVP